MPIIFTLRLLPNPPTKGPDFLKSYLSDLKIKAFDRSVADPSQDVEIGRAAGPIARPLDVLQIGTTPASLTPSIVLHFQPGPGVPLDIRAVATAIIVVNDDAATSQRPEFPDPSALDIRLEITRGHTKIQRDVIDFNISGKKVQKLSDNPIDYMGFPGHNPADPDFLDLPTGAYVFIPGPLPTDTVNPGPVIKLDPKGTPPEFGELVDDINAVLAKDHPPPAAATSLASAEPLTAPQAAEIAAELIWNRKLFPLPTPRISLEDLYTGSSTDNEQERVRFEGVLTAYYATHNADAEKLKRFVYTASAAVLAERLSFRETKATLTFPIHLSTSLAGETPTIPVTLTGPPDTTPPPKLTPSFAVPAAYFYALGISFSVNQKPEKLYARALMATAEFLTSSLQTAIDSGAIKDEAQETKSDEVIPKVTTELAPAIRRLTALSRSFATKPQYSAILQGNPGNTLSGDVAAFVTRWLSQTIPDAQLIPAFWLNEYGGNDYLEVILQVISDSKSPLETALSTFPGVPIARASDLLQITDQQWIAFFIADPTLLPEFTKPGDPEHRARAYVQFVRTLFSVSSTPVVPIMPIAGIIPSFGDYGIDMLGKIFSAIPGSLNLDNFPNDAVIDLALDVAFPDDESAQAWARQAINTLHDLYRITKALATGPADQFQFSCMEALFARGFRSIKTVLAVSDAQFRIGLQGTVAWTSAEKIYDAAADLGQVLPEEDGPNLGFKPVNPGNLIDCIPPDHLSPLGPVEYLHQALRSRSGEISLQDIMTNRRGNIGQLLVTKRNLEIELPQIDLVNESLEYLGSNLPTPHGVLQDTQDPQASQDPDRGKELEQALVTTPQWSTPAVPVANPSIYDDLKSIFTDPDLPYCQQLDIARCYLKMLGSSRFEIMRRFRRDITEFAMDALHEPLEFQRNLWRYPLHFDIALEYIQLSREEYEKLFTKILDPTKIAELYGIADTANFINQVSVLPNFLKSTGLEYCEFYELWKTQFEPLNIEEPSSQLPPCPPCCSDKITISTSINELQESAAQPWGRLIIFIRLWRRLQLLCQGRISFQNFSDICGVLHLFRPNTNATNPDFIRQLVSLLVLRDDLSLPWTDEQDDSASTKNEKRSKLLAIWVGPQNAPAEWEWAVTTLLSRIQAHAESKYHCPRRPPGFMKILSDNLDSLSRLAGFTVDFPWYLNPSCTLRFTEVLAKIFASEFTVGEIIFLFTAQDHLRGDDPYPLTEESEAQDDPLNAPEDDAHGLWELRNKLLCTSVSDTDIEKWTWSRIQAACVELGFKPSSTSPNVDALTSLGTHFFPGTLESNGFWVDLSSRRFSRSLAPNLTSPELWSGEHCKAFHYTYNAADLDTGELWTQLPLDDLTVFQQLVKSRQLNEPEMGAVRDLYFAPRAALAPFALIFENFGHAVEWLIHEPNEEARFYLFRDRFALFYRRCEVIALHLAEQVDALPGWTPCVAKDCGCGCKGKAPNVKAAWRILRTLLADENQAFSPWEDDSGKPPEGFMANTFSGSAFAVLFGSMGTGLLGRIQVGLV